MPTGGDRQLQLFDSSAAVPLLVHDHEFHGAVLDIADRSRRGLAGHAWFETYSVLTRMPAGVRRSPHGRLHRACDPRFPETRFLEPDAALALRGELAERRIAGGAVFDALGGCRGAPAGRPARHVRSTRQGDLRGARCARPLANGVRPVTKRWDVVIVGGGSAGCVLAERLSRDPSHARAAAGGRPAGLALGRVHPHARRAHLSHRQPVLRLAVRVGAGAAHERPAHLPRARQGPGRQLQHQRHDLPARQPARLRALGGRPGHGDLGLRPLPALLPAHGGRDRRGPRRPVPRPRRPADPGARPGHEPPVRGVLPLRGAGRLRPDR